MEIEKLQKQNSDSNSEANFSGTTADINMLDEEIRIPLINQVSQINDNLSFFNIEKLTSLIEKEKYALKYSNTTPKKLSFNEIKINVQEIQHNLQTFLDLPGKKKKEKK